MSNPPQVDSVIAGFTAPELREWSHHVECILRGLAHSMNNRAAALSAVLELSSDPDDDPAGTREILRAEMDRVLELVRVVRALGVPREEMEALTPADLVPELSAIAALHSDLRDRSVTIAAADAPPVRVQRWMLMRALVSFIATRRPRPGERAIAVTMCAEGEWLVVRSNAEGGESAYAAAMARRMDGEPMPDGSGFRVPTLEAVRRREAR